MSPQTLSSALPPSPAVAVIGQAPLNAGRQGLPGAEGWRGQPPRAQRGRRGGAGREDPERLAECSAHLPPPSLGFGASLNNFQVCGVSSPQRGTDSRVGIFVSFAAVSPVPEACPAHSSCSVNTGGTHGCSLPSGSLPTLFPLPGAFSLTLRNPAHSYGLVSSGFFQKAVPEPSKPRFVASRPLLTAPWLPPAWHLSHCFIIAPSPVLQTYWLVYPSKRQHCHHPPPL